MDVIRDAWPWVFLAFLIGVLCGWLVTWLYCRSRISALATPASTPPALTAAQLAEGSDIIGVRVRYNDLELVEGVGPKIAALLRADGITTWAHLAEVRISRLEKILEDGGAPFNIHQPGTWPAQATLLAAGRWAEFKNITDELRGGR